MNKIERRDVYFGGAWHNPVDGRYVPSLNPASGDAVAHVADCSPADVDRAVAAAESGARIWRDVSPFERAKALRAMATVLRSHARELALLDAVDCGNPVSALAADSEVSAVLLEYFAGLVTEMKGASIPVGPGALNFSVRQPYGVVARILAFNHPLLFCAGKIGAPLAAGNAVIVKPSEQAPLSALRFAELVDGLLPPGVFNVLTGGAAVGAALAGHPKVAKICLVGSAAAGRAVMRTAAETLKPVLLELGGKNALIAFPDADPAEVARAMVAGMNFAWCGQSCGSTSRAFIHADLHDAVLAHLGAELAAFTPGDPTDPATTMGAIVSERQRDRVVDFIRSAEADGATVLYGGDAPRAGCFIAPTVLVGVTSDMRVAREEIFGPVLSVLTWTDEAAMLDAVNAVEYGLTCSIWTNDLDRAHRTALGVETGYVWINETSRHILGAPFGGVKQSGIGREECLEELLAFTQEKNIYISLRQR
jgi:betaine-aldehyde dehydrogenase